MTCDEDIVISGMSGRFADSNNVAEFEYNLYNKINMMKEDAIRSNYTNPMIPKIMGRIPNISKFDAVFFGIHEKQANRLDPQQRMLVEEAFKAVMDAGVSPKSLRGSNTGVYIAASFSETEKEFYHNYQDAGKGIIGCRKAFFANRISYYLGLHGPSMIVDTACSSSITALDLAIKALQSGDIDAAIVGASNLCLHPLITLQFNLLGVISQNGTCFPFDSNASGYTRSEAVSCVLLQRKSVAKRIYATVLCSKINSDGFKQEGITYPSSHVQEKLIREIYSEARIDVNDLGYLEAHATSTIVGDPEECKGIDNAICKQRKEPLLVGSVKSNCGHSEPAAGICSLIKVILSLNNGIIPPNINFNSPRKSIEAVVSGRLKVVVTPTKLPKPVVAINCFGFGGSNGHVVLKQCSKEKRSYEQDNSNKYRLVTWSGRTKTSVDNFLSNLEACPLDEEYLALTQGSQAGGIRGMVFRGYTILNCTNNMTTPTVVNKNIQYYGGWKRPLVWVFSGIGSQWVGMGKSLMQLSLFKKSIQRSHNTLRPAGLDVVKIVSANDADTFKNIVHSHVGIAAMQIAFVDVLWELGLSPDLIVGHSVGELICAYADGSLTAEQVMLVAYYLGKVSSELNKIKIMQITIGVGFENIKSLLPKTIEVSCHNSSNSCTVVGPSKDVEEFVEQLKENNVNVIDLYSNFIYHNKYISHLGPELLKYLKHIIPNPKPRSNKWISSSVPRSQWFEENNKYSSAEYFTNNWMNCVLLEEVTSIIPKNAIIVDIAPHALIQSIPKKAEADEVYVALNQRNVQDSAQFFFNALGSLYVSGLELNLDKMYRKIEFPVSRGTKSFSSLIGFDHSKDYFVYFNTENPATNIKMSFDVKLSGHNLYLMGHEIDGRVLVPATFYLECVWRTFASMKGILKFDSFSVEFENVKFERATTLTEARTTELMVVVQIGSGQFEISESKSVVATGFIREIMDKTKPIPINLDMSAKKVSIKKKDLYKELKLRGYHYSEDFQSVEMAFNDSSYGKIKWMGNWVTFLDCMLQISILGKDTRSLVLPTKLRSLRIYPNHHQNVCKSGSSIEVFSSYLQNRIVSGGVEIIGLNASEIQRRKAPGDPVIETYKFVPHFPSPKLSLDDIARCCIQLILENQPKLKLQIIQQEITKPIKLLLSLMQAVGDLPLVTGNYIIYHQTGNKSQPVEEIPNVTHIYPDDNLDKTGDIVVLSDNNSNSTLLQHISKNGFLILKEPKSLTIDKYKPPPNLVPIAFFPSEFDGTFVLLQKMENVETLDDITCLEISTSDNKFEWVQELQELIKKSQNILVVSQHDQLNGILGIINCLRKEPETKNIRCVLIDDPKAPAFNIHELIYKKHLQLGLAVNVYRKGCWGTYRHLKILEVYPNKIHKVHVFGKIGRIGDLSSLKWVQGPLAIENAKVKVVYSSLNFKDIMIASGRLSVDVLDLSRINQTSLFGFEYSGIDLQNGKPIMGMSFKSTVGSHIEEKSLLTWDVPQNWSLRDAATVPVVYLTVYYAFFYTADIRNGKSILIHAGSGGIGLAAIRVALAYGLEVFTTVSTDEKKMFLLKTFSDLKENNIGNSRDNSFEDLISERTQGKGVDFVLNSLSEDKLISSMRCLGKRGHFLEIGKFDMANDNSLGLGVFLNELSFHAILADKLFECDGMFIEKLKQHMSTDIAKGIIQPLPSTIFAAPEIEKAFRYLMSGKHVGKVLIQVRKDPQSEVTLPISAQPQIYFLPNLVYIVPGGLGGFGLELVDWMILRGARKIVFCSTRGISNDYQLLRITLWKNYSCEVIINTSDIGTIEGCRALLTEAMKLGDVGGIFNLAVLLKDAVFSNQSVELFQQSFRPKAIATKYLDEISRKLCPKLHHFVVFSSVSCGRGNAGQTNYGMANSIMERIIEDRVAHGFPGKAIQWGAVGEVGLVAEMAAGKIDLEIGGTLQQRISSCIEVLDVLLSTPDPVVASMVVAEKKAQSFGQSPIEFVLNTMSIKDIKSISMTSTLTELGMDSLMSVEIIQTFERDYEIALNSADLRSLTFANLIELSENAKVVTFDPTSKDDEKSNQVDSIKHLRQFYGEIKNLGYPNLVLDHVNNISNGDPIIILPGIDGCSGEVWHDIGKKLKQPAYVLQYHKTLGAKNIEELVDFVTKTIAEHLTKHKTKHFQIVAFSFGAMVGHYTVASLEDKGYQGKVILIDGSPQFLQHIILYLQNIYEGIELDKMTLSVTLSILLPDLPYEIIQADLQNMLFKEEWLRYIYNKLNKHKYENIDAVCSNIEAIYQRLKMLQNPESYENIGIVNADFLLIKPKEETIAKFDDFFGLSPFTRSNIQTDMLEGDHRTMLQNTRLPDIINSFFNNKK